MGTVRIACFARTCNRVGSVILLLGAKREVLTALLLMISSLFPGIASAEMYASEPEAYDACMAFAKLNYEARIYTNGATAYKCIRTTPNANAYVGAIWLASCRSGCPYYWSVGYGRSEWPLVSIETRKNLGPGICCAGTPPNTPVIGTHAGNPINVATGNKYQREPDLEVSSLLAFVRHYNSHEVTQQYGLGAAWTHSYSRRIQYSPTTYNGMAAKLHRPDGGYLLFLKQQDGSWVPETEVFDTLVTDRDGTGTDAGWTYTNRSNLDVEKYDTLGRLIALANSSGDTISLEYNGGVLTGTEQDLLLTRVTDRAGRSLFLHYDSSGRLDQITDPNGAVYSYAYDIQGLLSKVTHPNGVFRSYLYNEAAYTAGANLPRALTGIVDESGQRSATYKYDASGRAVSTEHAGGVNKATVKYGSSTATVTDALGNPQYRSFQSFAGVMKLTHVVNQCASCPTSMSEYRFDSNMHLDTVKDFRGYTADHDRNADDLEILLIDAKGSADERKTQTDWDAALRRPLERRSYDSAGTLVRKETWVYNSRGQAVSHSVVEP